jgi:hypothetical protein
MENNIIVFQNGSLNDRSVLNSISFGLVNICNFLGVIVLRSNSRHVSWKPPPSNVYKLNVDDSSFGNLENSDNGGMSQQI